MSNVMAVEVSGFVSPIGFVSVRLGIDTLFVFFMLVRKIGFVSYLAAPGPEFPELLTKVNL